MTDILMVIKTTGISYDDRLRKECKTLMILGKFVKIAALTSENKVGEGITDYGSLFQKISLWSRKIFSHKKWLLLKTIEMYVRFVQVIMNSRPTIVWLHNIEMAGLIPFCWIMKKLGLIKKIIWDQHELPDERVLNNRTIRAIFKYFLRICDVIIAANNERREFLIDRLGSQYGSNFIVIENFVDDQFYSLPKGSLPHEIEKWLNGQSYILAQGGANPGRYLENLVAALMELKDMKLIVVGPFEEKKIRLLKSKQWKTFDEKIFFTGMVPQFKLVDYIDNSLASVILYNSEKLNSRLCAPNRLYQAVARGIPVIVGSNPPMKNLVKLYACGVVLRSDGRDVADIREGICSILRHFRCKSKPFERIEAIRWESQIDTMAAIV
jgi:hypothetical protein